MIQSFLHSQELCCLDDAVYRAYNNGFSQGKDSNHRFVTDRALLEPLFNKGWADEGIGFCVPK